MRQSPIFILFACFLVQNLTAGFAFGSFGPLLSSNEEYFAIGRGGAAAGMSVVMLAIGFISPIAGSYIERISAQKAIFYGTLASAGGYWLLAFATTFEFALVGYGLIGAGVSLSAILGPLSLVSKAYVKNRGKALSIVNLPIALLVCPYIVASLLPGLGRTMTYVSIGVLFLLLALFSAVALRAPKRSAEEDLAGPLRKSMANAQLLRGAPLWLLSIGVGIIAGTGAAYYVHAVPFGLGRNLSLQAASGLVSSYAGAGIVGTLLFGWIADRIGPARALTLSAALQAVFWWALLQASGVQIFFVAALLGMCAVPQNTLLGATSSALFGSDAVKAMGLCFAIKLPILFSVAPLLGMLFEKSNSYNLAFICCSLSLVFSTFILALLAFTKTNLRQE